MNKLKMKKNLEISVQVDEVNENNEEDNNNVSIDTKETTEVSEVIEEETIVNADENLINSSNTENVDVEIK